MTEQEMTKQEKARKIAKAFGFDSVGELIAFLESVSDGSAEEKQRISGKVPFIEEESELSLENKVKRILRRMGAPANLNGYQQLTDAIVLGLKDKECLERITINLYPKVAEKNDTMPFNVERAIRHVIERIYERGEIKQINKVVGSCNTKRGRLTNSAFICAFVEYIRMGGV